MSFFVFPARAPVATALSALLALALTLAHDHAQAADRLDAADPHAVVPATRYEPAIRYAAAPPAASTPDRGWVAANAVVGGARAPATAATPAMQAMQAGLDGAGHEHHAMPTPMQRACTSAATAGTTSCGTAPADASHDHGAPP